MRRHERVQGRHLLDAPLAGWPDLASEGLLTAISHWRVPASQQAQLAASTRYISFRDGLPERAISLQVVQSSSSGVWLR